MAKIRALLFDKDGTLLDFESTYGAATAKVLMTLAAGSLFAIAIVAKRTEEQDAAGGTVDGVDHVH